MTIWRAYCDPSWPQYLAIPGQVVGHTSEGVLVKTGDSMLLVKEEQVGSAGPAMWAVGTRLGLDLGGAVQVLLARVATLERHLRGEAPMSPEPMPDRLATSVISPELPISEALAQLQDAGTGLLLDLPKTVITGC